MKESVEFERINNTTLVFLCSNCLQVTKIFYDCRINYYFWRFWYLITRLKDLVHLSILQGHYFIR